MAINYCNQEIKGTLTTTGAITSGGSITMPDYIYHTGDTNTYFGFNGSDDFRIYAGNTLKMIADGTRVRLYYNGSEKFSTTSTGIEITGGLTTSASSSIAGINMTADIAMGDYDITGIDELVWTSGTKLRDNGTNYLQLNYASTGAGGILIVDGDSGTQGYLYADGQTTSGFGLLDGSGSWAVRCVESQYVELRYNNSTKFQTSNTGITVTGNVASTTATTTANMTIGGDLTISGGDITLTGTGRIQGIDTVSSGTDAANKTYVDNAVTGAGSGTYVPLAGGTMTGSLIVDGGGSSSIYLKTKGSARIALENASATDSFYISNTGGSGSSTLDLGGALTLVEGGLATFTDGINMTDGELLMWGGNSILTHSGSATTIGDNSSGSVISIAGGNSTFGGNIYMTGTGHIGAADNFYVGGATAGTDHTYIGDSGRNVTIYNGATFTVASGATSLGSSLTVNGAITMTDYIYHSSDSNTYFGFNTADSIQLVTGGGQRLLANNNGVKIGGGATVTTILDEDNMASDSATALATQQSIKAYVDSSTTGVLTYQGTWNADTNSPTLSSGSGTPGYYYIVSTAGSTNLDGITDWAVGDWAVFSDQATDAWQKIDNTAVGNISGSGVSSRVTYWNGTGSVTSTSGFTFDGSNLAIPGYLTISGNQLVSPSNFTIDVGGSITLDADGSDILLSDGGTVFGKFASYSNNLNIYSQQQDQDIVFRGNDGGSGIVALTLDMSDGGTAEFGNRVYVPEYIAHSGDSDTLFGFSGANTYIVNTGGTTALTINSSQAATFAGDVTVGDELTITTIGNATADPDKFLCASGGNKVGYRTGAQVLSDIGAASSGSLSNYLPLAGGTMTGNVIFNDNVQGLFGTGSDLKVFHDGSASSIDNYTGSLNIREFAADGDIIFSADNGSGGGNITEYFRIDGSGQYLLVSAALGMYFNDGIAARFGNSGDLYLYHNGTESVIANEVGNFYISQRANNGNIIFESDDGSGGITSYFRVDGAGENVQYAKNILLYDNVQLLIGSGGDFQAYHNGSTTYLRNNTGTLEIRNQTSGASDIYFKTTTSSPSLDTFIILDGSAEQTQFTKDTEHQDGVYARFGNSSDLSIVHNGSTGYIQNYTGDLQIQNNSNGDDILFRCDDGSGGLTTYFYLNGGDTNINFQKDTLHPDNVKAKFGTSADLQIYHDGSNSFIRDLGTGNLLIDSNGAELKLRVNTTENALIANSDGSVELYYNNIKRFETTSNGIEVTGKTNTDTLLIGSSIEVDAILDEDNMASNSATSLATQQSIKAYVDAISVPTVNNSTISLSATNGLVGSSSFTLNQASNQTITFSLSINSLSTSTTAGDADFFIVGTQMGAEYKMAPANIALSHFNNDSGWTTNAGTVTSVSVGTGLDISNSTTTPSITMDLTELTLGSGLDATTTGLSLDFSEFVSANSDEVTSFIVYNSGDDQAERLLLANVHDIEAYWKYTPVVFNGAFNDSSSSTSTFYIPIAGSYSEGTSSQEYQFAAMPFAGRIRTLMMQNTGTTPTTTNSTRMKIYKNGSLAYTTSYQVPTNSGSVGAYILFDNNTAYTFSAGDRIQFAYNKQFTGDYWRDVAFTAVVEFQEM